MSEQAAGIPTGVTPATFCPGCGGTRPTCCSCTEPPSAAHVLYAQLGMLTRWAEVGYIDRSQILRSKAALEYAREHGIAVPLEEGETPDVLKGWWRLNHKWLQPADASTAANDRRTTELSEQRERPESLGPVSTETRKDTGSPDSLKGETDGS